MSGACAVSLDPPDFNIATIPGSAAIRLRVVLPLTAYSGRAGRTRFWVISANVGLGFSNLSEMWSESRRPLRIGLDGPYSVIRCGLGPH